MGYTGVMKISRIYLGADHAGFALKEKLKTELTRQGYEIQDLAPRYISGDDYPRYGKTVAQAVARDKNSRGVLVCGSGVGMVIAANRVRGARAFLGQTVGETILAREHNDINILVLAGWRIRTKQALAVLQTFLKIPFSKASRHQRRVKQLG